VGSVNTRGFFHTRDPGDGLVSCSVLTPIPHKQHRSTRLEIRTNSGMFSKIMTIEQPFATISQVIGALHLSIGLVAVRSGI